MTSQNVWIGISIGVFFAGFFIGGSVFGIFSTEVHESPPPIETVLTGPGMMSDPQLRGQMMNQMTSDDEFMQQWMSDPNHVQRMVNLMQQNREFMDQASQVIIDNQDLRLQMIGNMIERPEVNEQMKYMMEQENSGSRMMSPQSLCQKYGGNWLDEFNECEFISQEQCAVMNGLFKQCESACRHMPDAEICTKQCVPVCIVP